MKFILIIILFAINESAESSLNSVNKQNSKNVYKEVRESCTLDSDCEWRIKASFDAAHEECSHLKSKALTCCGSDLSQCAAGDINSITAAQTANSVTGTCQQIKQAASNMQNLVQKISYQCQTDSSSCAQLCDQKIKEKAHFVLLNTCAYNLDESSYLRETSPCSEDLINKYVSYYKDKLSSIVSNCQLVNTQSRQQAQVAIAEVLKSYASAESCVQQVASGDGNLNHEVITEQTKSITNTASSHLIEVADRVADAAALKQNNKQNGQVGAHRGSGGDSYFNKASANKGSPSFSSSTFGDSVGTASYVGKDEDSSANGKALSYGTLSASPNAANKIVAGKGHALKKANLDTSNKQKDKVAKNKKEQVKSKPLAGPVKAANNRQPQSNSLRKYQIKGHDSSNIKTMRLGSPHDSIFKRISDRMLYLCRTKRLKCTD